MSGASWYSSSKKQQQPVEQMTLPHARNVLAKLNRGEGVSEDGTPLHEQAEGELREALELHILELESRARANAELDARSQAGE